MDILIPQPLPDQPRNLIRRAGYAEFRDPNTGETSYVRRLHAGAFYPRFHAYLKEGKSGELVIALHLDQKKPSYGIGHAHAGEYDGPVVEREAERIRQVIIAVSRSAPAEEKRQKGFFGRLFGL